MIFTIVNVASFEMYFRISRPRSADSIKALRRWSPRDIDVHRYNNCEPNDTCTRFSNILVCRYCKALFVPYPAYIWLLMKLLLKLIIVNYSHKDVLVIHYFSLKLIPDALYANESVVRFKIFELWSLEVPPTDLIANKIGSYLLRSTLLIHLFNERNH